MNDIYQQPPPNTIKLEPTEGCTLACWFCAIQSIRNNGANRATQTNGKTSGPFKFMTVETAERIASQVAGAGWSPRWEIAGRGEPTANAKVVEIVAAIRRHCPRSYILLTTNGSGLALRPERTRQLFDAGVNALALDDYKHAPYVAKILNYVRMGMFDFPLMEYPQDLRANPYQRTPAKVHRFILLRDITEGGGVRTLTNQGGSSGNGELLLLRESCAKPFREMTFRHDGRVALCCDDWRGEFHLPTIHEADILALWLHPRLDAARRLLLRKDRRFAPCHRCNVRTKRNGLLPDKMGQEKSLMGPINPQAKELILAATSGKPLTVKS